MTIKALDHIHIIPRDQEQSVRFYCDIIGLVKRIKPDRKQSQVAYLYIGPDSTQPVVYIASSETKRTKNNFHPLDHIAFSYDFVDFETIKNRLLKHHIPFEYRERDDQTLKQLFIKDPDGILIELNFNEV